MVSLLCVLLHMAAVHLHLQRATLLVQRTELDSASGIWQAVVGLKLQLCAFGT